MAASVRYQQSAPTTATSLLVAMVATSSFCYSSLSVVGENPGLQKRSAAVKIALDSDKFRTVSDMASADEFIHSRRQLFGFDERRFPAYFRDYSMRDKSALFTPSIVKPSGSTAFLADYLLTPGVLVPHIHSSTQAARDAAHRIVVQALSERENRAIIFSLFRKQAQKTGELAPYVSAGIRRAISAAYGLNMVRSMNGTILTGIQHISYYDDHLLEKTFALPIGTVYALLRYCGDKFMRRISSGDPDIWKDAIDFLHSSDGDLVSVALWARYENVIAEAPELQREALEQVLHAEVRSICRLKSADSDDWRTNILSVAESLMISSREHTYIKESAMRILITYANEREYLGILDSLRITPQSMAEPIFGTTIAYDRLPDRNGVEMFLVQTETGSVGAGASQATISDAIDKLHPTLVAAVGVGFALIEGPDIDGTVLIATRVRPYEKTRVGTKKDGSLDLRERGEARDVDPIELQRLRIVARRTDVKYEPGEIISGEKLVDWLPFKTSLKKRFPDAVGGDQELAGIVAACSRKKVPWVFLKAVSDRGDGNKKAISSTGTQEVLNDDDRQRRAARKAMDIFCRYVDALSTVK